MSMQSCEKFKILKYDFWLFLVSVQEKYCRVIMGSHNQLKLIQSMIAQRRMNILNEYSKLVIKKKKKKITTGQESKHV